MSEISKLADGVIEAMRGYVDRAVKRFEDRIKALEDRPILKGDKGDVGEIGPKGKDGIDGVDGKEGQAGPKGDTGEKGDRGDAGPAGSDGAPGRDGKDGAQGIQGERGPKGEKGETGERGQQGEKGDPGQDGKEGAQGIQGEKGIDGRDGLEGPPGKDALQIEVLSDLDPEKKYRRNTYAAFRGGLVRSFRATDPITKDLESAGWHVVMNGIDSTESTLEGKTLSVTIKRTDGQIIVQKSVIPVMVYRGIYRDDEEYDLGDVVTRDGCAWHLGSEQKGFPGEPNKDTGWTMAVKKGRDGRDGLRGEKGERGAEGRSGKDATQLGPNGGKW